MKFNMLVRYAAPAAILFAVAACSEDAVDKSTGLRAPNGSPVSVIDITDPNETTIISGAAWSSTVTFGVGTGVIDPFLSIQNSGTEEGSTPITVRSRLTTRAQVH